MSMVSRPEQWSGIKRVYVLAFLICVGLVSIVARLWYLQVARGPELYEASMDNQLRLIRRLAPRGIIEDRNGKIIGANRYQVVVSVVPNEVAKNPGVLDKLAELLQLDKTELAEFVKQEKNNEFDPVRVAVDVDIATTTKLEEQRLNLPGVIVGPEPIRFYPDGQLCGHIVGQMGQIGKEELKLRKNEGYKPGDFCGKLGIERAYDKALHGIDGGREVQVDARGRLRKEIGDTEAIPGGTVTLTIDKDMQKIAYDGLHDLATKGHPGAAVALDPQTGAVLTLVSVPAYDPNQFVKGITAKDWGEIRDNPLKPQINRAVAEAVAPGSTFKLVTATAGLDSGRLTVHDREYCTGAMALGHWVKHCHKAGGHGSVDVFSALQQSCDIYFYRAAQKIGPERLAVYAKKFGLGQRTGIDLQRDGDNHIERAGMVPDPEWKMKHYHQEWLGGETVDYGIGQAMLGCTPIQMCNLAAAIGNGGTLYRPQLVQKITRFDERNKPHVVHELEPIVNSHVGVPQAVLDKVITGMKMVMAPGGTAAGAAIPGLEIAGKTGTAQMHQNGKMINNAWFVAYAPVQHPRLAICVFVEGGGHGGVVAGPIARKMFQHYFHIRADGGGAGGGDLTD